MIRVTLVALLLAASPAAFAQMYKCVDAKGKTQYSDKPLPGCKSTLIKGEAPPPAPGKSPQPKKAGSAGFTERNNFARDQATRCSQARAAVKRGSDQESVRQTLRDCS
jgi:hypothetical protein